MNMHGKRTRVGVRKHSAAAVITDQQAGSTEVTHSRQSACGQREHEHRRQAGISLSGNRGKRQAEEFVDNEINDLVLAVADHTKQTQTSNQESGEGCRDTCAGYRRHVNR